MKKKFLILDKCDDQNRVLKIREWVSIEIYSAPSFASITYRPVGGGRRYGPCPRHCTLTVNPSDRNSTGTRVGTSWGGGWGE